MELFEPSVEEFTKEAYDAREIDPLMLAQPFGSSVKCHGFVNGIESENESKEGKLLYLMTNEYLGMFYEAYKYYNSI